LKVLSKKLFITLKSAENLTFPVTWHFNVCCICWDSPICFYWV